MLPRLILRKLLLSFFIILIYFTKGFYIFICGWCKGWYLWTNARNENPALTSIRTCGPFTWPTLSILFHLFPGHTSFCMCIFPYPECVSDSFPPKQSLHFPNYDDQHSPGYYTDMIPLVSQPWDLGWERLEWHGSSTGTWFFQITESMFLFLGLLSSQKSSLTSLAKYSLSPPSSYGVLHWFLLW